jgi:hypothetical protein
LTKNGNTSCIENRMKKHFKREEKWWKKRKIYQDKKCVLNVVEKVS